MAYGSKKIGVPPVEGLTKRWELVEEKVITADCQKIDFEGLDGDKDVEYLLTGRIDNKDSGVTSYYWRLNKANQPAGYRAWHLFGYDGTADLHSVGHSDDSIILGADGSSRMAFNVYLFAKTGFRRYWLSSYIRRLAGTYERRAIDIRGELYDETTKYTEIGIFSSTTTGIGAGSIISLFRKRK